MAFIQNSWCEDYLVSTILHYGIDASNYNDLKALVQNEINAGRKKIILNLANVVFMDSFGIGALIHIKNKISRDGKLLLMGLNPEVIKVFALAGLQKYFPILDLNNYPMKCPFCALYSQKQCLHPQILWKIQEEFYVAPPDGSHPSLMSKLDMTVKAITGQLRPEYLMNRQSGEVGQQPYYDQSYDGKPPSPPPSQQNMFSPFITAAKAITGRLTGRLPKDPQARQQPPPPTYDQFYKPTIPPEILQLQQTQQNQRNYKKGFKLGKLLVYSVFIITVMVIFFNLKWLPNDAISNFAITIEDQITSLILSIEQTIFPSPKPSKKKKKKITQEELDTNYDRNNDGEFDSKDWKLLDSKIRLELINRGYKPNK